MLAARDVENCMKRVLITGSGSIDRGVRARSQVHKVQCEVLEKPTGRENKTEDG